MCIRDRKRPDVLYGYPNTLISYSYPGSMVPPWLAEGIAQFMYPGADWDNWDSSRDMLLRDQVLRVMRNWHVYNGEYRNEGFQPHTTIAFANLRKANYFDVWDAFKYQKYETSFFVNEITLFKYQSDNWNQMRSFPFMDSN